MYTIGYASPPNIGALTPPMHDQYNFSYSITHNCSIIRPLPMGSVLETVSTKTLLIIIFLCLKLNNLYPLVIFSKCIFFSTHVSFWFLLYRSAKLVLKLVQKLGRDKQSKMYLQFAVFFTPCYSLFTFFLFVFKKFRLP